MLRNLSIVVLLVACGSKSAEPTAGSGSGSGSSAIPPAGSGSGSGSATPVAPSKAELPAGRDAEIAKLVKAGSACKVENEIVELNCPENQAAGTYADKNQKSVELGATCAELVRDTNLGVKGVALFCLLRADEPALTPVFGHVLDSLELENSKKLREQIAYSIRGASAAKIEDRVIALIHKLVAGGEEDAAAHLLYTMFPRGGTPSKATTDLVLEALLRKKGPFFSRAADLGRLLDDKPAACKALATAGTPAEGTDWASAVQAIEQVSECSDVAAGVLQTLISDDKLILAKAEDVRRLSEKFDLTPEVRKQATEAITKAKASKDASDSQKTSLGEALAALAKKK